MLEHVRPSDRIFEWGSGETTLELAKRCKHVTTVEHQADWAVTLLKAAGTLGLTNISVLVVPPNLPYVEGTDDDGDVITFRDYVHSYTGEGIDVVLIDGRARVSCARHIVEIAQFGPHPDLRVFVHDVDRQCEFREGPRSWVGLQYLPIWDATETGPGETKGHLREVARVGRLMLCGAKL